MVMLETTNNIFNQSLYQYVTPQTALAWQRVRVATYVANNGSYWGEMIRYNNSGVHCVLLMSRCMHDILSSQAHTTTSTW